MSDTPTDGGPAFARGSTLYPNSTLFTESQTGMSLRDWFAGQALAGQLASMSTAAAVAGIRQEDAPRWCARSAYMFADAMLAARKTSTGGQE